MTERESLIAAIHAAPGDDLPRLVFADWLEEHGDPEWAEFIRAQCGVARLWQYRGVDCDEGHEWNDLWMAEGRLWEGGIRDRFRDLFRIGWAKYGSWNVVTESAMLVARHPETWPISVVRRGFVHTVRGPLALLRRHLPAIVREHPVEQVEVTDVPWLNRSTPEISCIGGVWLAEAGLAGHDELHDIGPREKLADVLSKILLTEARTAADVVTG